MDAREAAGWAWMEAKDRKRWLDQAQARLRAVGNRVPGVAGQFADPALQTHVRKRQAEAAKAAEAARRKRKEPKQ